MRKDELLNQVILNGDAEEFRNVLRRQHRRQWPARIAIALGLIALAVIGWLGYITIHATIIQQGFSGLGGGQ